MNYLRSWVDAELQLGFLSIINRQSLHEERSKSRSSSTTERMEDEKALKSSTLISQLPNSVQDKINYLLTNSIVASSIVISGILLASHKLFRVEQLFVCASTDLINDRRLKVNEHGSKIFRLV